MQIQEQQIEQVFFNVPLNRLEPIFKNWVRDVLTENPLPPTVASEPEQTFTIKELAAYLKVTVCTIQAYKRKKMFPFYQVNRTVLFKKSEIDTALSSKSLAKKGAKNA